MEGAAAEQVQNNTDQNVDGKCANDTPKNGIGKTETLPGTKDLMEDQYSQPAQSRYHHTLV